MIAVRLYGPEDAAATLEVFRRAVHDTASADYSPAQVAAWAPDDLDGVAWQSARARPTTFVAVSGSGIVGFTQILTQVDGTGHVEMMFVDPGAGRRGVASTLLTTAVAHARSWGARTLTTDASLTARPFFEAHGFAVEAEQHPTRRGVTLTNYRMTHELS